MPVKSVIWTFFEKGKNDVKCKICGHVHLYKAGGTTSNMLRHVKIKHPFEYEKENGKMKQPGKRSHTTANNDIDEGPEKQDDREEVASASTSTAEIRGEEGLPPHKVQKDVITGKPRTVQETIFSNFDRKKLYRPESLRKKRLDELVLDLVILDMQPLSVVEDTGFRRLVNELDPKYQIISRKQLTQVLLPKKYNTEKAKLLSKLKTVDSLSVTTDQWSSRTNEGYTTITAHFIDDDWKLHSPVLMTRHKAQRHTAINLANELEASFAEFDINDKVTAVVTDNASNITAAITRLENVEGRQACFAHTLNLCVRHALTGDPETKVLVKKIKDIVSFFHSSNNAVDELKNIHKIQKTSFYKLKQDVETRWNSTYMMMESFQKQLIAVSTVLGNRGKVNLCLTDADQVMLTEALAVLKPFFDITQEISSEQHTSISKMIPMIQILHKKLESKASTLSAGLKYQLESYFAEMESHKFVKFATFLDPRFKNFLFKEEDRVLIREEIQEYLEKNKTPDEQSEEAASGEDEGQKTQDNNRKSTEESFWDQFDKEREDESSAVVDVSTIEKEMNMYLEGKPCIRKRDPLTWWQEQEKYLPNMAKAARKYLSIPANSVPSERVFSKAGEIVSARRNRIKSKNVDMILFLNKLQQK